MLHYDPQHVSSSTLLILRRTNYITTASGIVTLCKQPYSMQVESGLSSIVSATQTILNSAWRTNYYFLVRSGIWPFHNRVVKRPSLVHALSQMNLPSYLRSIALLFHLCLGLPSGSFLQVPLCGFFFSFTRTTFPAIIMILYSVTRISDEEYKSLNSLLYIFSGVLSRRLRPNYLGTVLSNTVCVCFFLSSRLLMRFGLSAASVMTG